MDKAIFSVWITVGRYNYASIHSKQLRWSSTFPLICYCPAQPTPRSSALHDAVRNFWWNRKWHRRTHFRVDWVGRVPGPSGTYNFVLLLKWPLYFGYFISWFFGWMGPVILVRHFVYIFSCPGSWNRATSTWRLIYSISPTKRWLYVHTIPDRFCAGTKTIPERASVHKLKRWFRCEHSI